LLRKAAKWGRRNGRMKMAKATTVDTSTAKSPKPAKAPAAPVKPNMFARLGTYIRDVRTEMSRVVWPTRPEVLNSSVVVVTTLIFFIAFITFVDYVIVIPVIQFIGHMKIGG
jgi:preprotein translocase subunit SecE